MKRLMITGASGLLGSNLVLEAEDSFEVTAIIHNHPLKFRKAKVKQIDLTDPIALHGLFLDVRPEWIIHCAAETNPDDLEREPERASLVNKTMAAQVAREAASMGSRLIYVSTDSVFDGRADSYGEADIPNPLNIYARSKLEGEIAVIQEHPEASVIRVSLFGWSPGRRKSLAEWFFSRLSAGEPCIGLSDVYFSPVYAPDFLAIFIQVLEEGLSGVYHVPGDVCLSKYEFGCRLAEIFGLSQTLIQRGTSDQMRWAAERPKRTCLDGSKIIQALGIELPRLDAGLARFRAGIHRWQ
jgi:dTDP-4-dehydrorhamnose reductase